MSWENILKIDVIKFDDMMREQWNEFGLKLVNILEQAGFEIERDERYESYRHNIAELQEPYVQRLKVREYTHMTEKDIESEEGYGAYGHELIITDRSEPYAYGEGSQVQH